MNCVYVPLKSQNNYIGAQAEHVKIDPSTSQYFRKETENEMFWICKATAKILWRDFQVDLTRSLPVGTVQSGNWDWKSGDFS